jgi:SAM-dependent methyltransferase
MVKWFARRRAIPDPVTLAPMLDSWMHSPLGSALIEAEKAQLAPVISRVFGYHMLQLSCSPGISMLDECPVGHKICFAPAWDAGQQAPVADNEALPLGTDSIDAVLLHHALDFTPDSHRLLREATRVLMPGGRLLILGFNPVSMWGLSGMVRWHRPTPWNARFISRRRLTDWLSLLDFHVEKVSYGGFMPPIRHPKILSHAHKFERWFDQLGNPTGAFYLIVASKQRMPLTPVTSRWPRLRAPALGAPLAETGRVASGRGTVIPMPPRKNLRREETDK